MKIVSWNCRGGFYSYKKYKKIQKLDADIYVILEINKPKNVTEDYKKFIKDNPILLYEDDDDSGYNKGIAIIAKKGIKLNKTTNWDFKYNDFLSVCVNDSFDLIAVWTHDWERINGVKEEYGSKEYIKRMEDFLKQHKTDFEKSENLVICGDFNIDISLKEQKGQDKYVTLLNKYGYESIYHKLTNEEFGKESTKTFYRDDGNLHMDYLFTKPEIVKSFKLGSKDEYIGPAKTDKSDHVPLIFEIDI